jgi:nucleoside-diphosphate-sugar epimerase
MKKLTEIVSEEQLVGEDLEYLRNGLAEELAEMSGHHMLITGGAGFLGYYFVKTALDWNRANPTADPIRVTVYDNFLRGLPDWLEALQPNEHLSVQKQDLIQPLPADMPDFDYIVHAAGIASPIYYRKYPVECIDANINGLRNLLEYSVAQRERGKPIKAFLFFSSSEIYGDPAASQIPTPEDYRGNVSCTGPRACYDESKRFGETMCVVFAQQYDLPVKIARPFNNYGPGLKITDRRVIPDFARNVLDGEDIVMFSDGSPTRTFCYSTDALTGYYKVLVRGHQGESYNIGIERPEISMRELAELIIDKARLLFEYKGKLVTGASQDDQYLVDNPNRRCPIITKAREHLGYDPRVECEEGVTRSLIWYYHNQQAAEA